MLDSVVCRSLSRSVSAIVTQNAEGIPDAPCPAGSVKNCDDDEHPRYSPVKGKAAVMVAKTGKLYAVYNAANNSALKSVPELAAEGALTTMRPD